MYFEIENTLEHIKRARRAAVVQKNSPKEECPRLILAPFSRPPQVVFDDVLIGSYCERELEVFNPSKQVQQITLGKALPPGLEVHLPGEWLTVEPETCYCLTMMWSPMQPTALRETIRFTNENRGRYDVIVVLKSAMNVKSNQPKGFKISPGKVKKKTGKKSPVAIYKKKAEIIYNATKIKKTVVESTHYNVQRSSNILKPSNKENKANFEYSIESQSARCPFDSPSSINLNFDTTEIFSNMRKTTTEHILQDTYDKPYSTNQLVLGTQSNVLKPSNKQSYDVSASELFDELTFTPLKAVNKCDKLAKGPKIILSSNSDSEFNDSLDLLNSNKENEDTRSIICITSSQPLNRAINANNKQDKQLEYQMQKIPNTSSPKEMNSPNFTMNTEISRISDLSFLPSRFSTERKVIPKSNETHELFDDARLNSDTYTKESPNTPLIDFQVSQLNAERPPHYFMRDQPKVCRQALFKESQQYKEFLDINYLDIWNRDPKFDVKSPPRSITPPLQSIPEESTTLGDTQTLDETNPHMNTFTLPMNRTFDKLSDRNSTLTTSRETWSKKSIRAEPELWKIPAQPPRKSMKPKASIGRKETVVSGKTSINSDKSLSQNISLNQVGNVYSQSATVDPFLSASYFYDEEAVHKFETEFMRWLNYILTPPADLESNVEQKINVGKAWLENRNKEIPLAPTKEQVCSNYHNSHRLKSLRRSARTLLMSPEISQVIQKLNLQIDKKLLAIRTDRNLHLDVGLQKAIMELLLSYNPLWLRIGLEAVYGLVLPLKSNSDIEGLTTFIIQRMFKNPFLKNKHSKSSAPNMLLPAYMEAIKKFTLKKFFMLVFFLDQAKQKKLIAHDPCLFCRNAVCKESREIIIRFTRELIAGIGDITKHLRPIGYVVCVKQSYLDEYKYAVHNIATDMRDGVRLAKVLEIILIKNGLLNQLRTPAISRLQKIHNVQVALNALKEANFTIDGDISAQDIADGHREKTLSLLWQLIHVLRAPLFEKASVVIQTWWRKKYEVILEKRREKELLLQKQNNAASIIQYWWRQIQYNRLVEWEMKQTTSATIVIQKYCRKWLCRTRFLKIKRSALKIEEWYRSVRMIRDAKASLKILRAEREKRVLRSITTLQSYVRRWLCVTKYQKTVKKIIIIQSVIRSFILRKRYSNLIKTIIYIQKSFKGKLQMRQEMVAFSRKKNAVITIQRKFRAHLLMRQQREEYLKLKNAAVTIQLHLRSYQAMKLARQTYNSKKNFAILIQRRFRAQKSMKAQKTLYESLKKAALTLQKKYRALVAMRQQRRLFLELKNATIVLQRRYRAQILMRTDEARYKALHTAIINVQRRFRAQLQMRKEKTKFLHLRSSTMTIQAAFRAHVLRKQERQNFLKQKQAAVTIQNWFRNCKKGKEVKQQYAQTRQACVAIQRVYRAYIVGRKQRQEFIKIKIATVCIQKYYRSYIEMKIVRQQFIQLKMASVVIQKYYKSYLETKLQRNNYLKMRSAALMIQDYYRRYVESMKIRNEYCKLRKTVVFIQQLFRSICLMKKERQRYLTLKCSAVTIQRQYRALLEMRTQRQSYLKIRASATIIQRRFRAQQLMSKAKMAYLAKRKACITIQRAYRAYSAGKKQREQYLTLRKSVVVLQQRYRALLSMKKERNMYMITRNAIVTIQTKFKARLLMLKERSQFLNIVRAAVIIQRTFRAHKDGKKQRIEYTKIRSATITIQSWYRRFIITKEIRTNYMLLRNAAVFIQRQYRAKLLARGIRRQEAAQKIQTWYRSLKKRNECRNEFLKLKTNIIILQSAFRGFIVLKQFRALKNAAIKIQSFYRSYKLTSITRQKFLHKKTMIIKLQAYVRAFVERRRFLKIRTAVLTIQAAYRLKKRRELLKLRREAAAICIQKNFRRYLAQSRFKYLQKRVLYVQNVWRGKLVTRMLRCEFQQKRRIVVMIQARIRGFLVRKFVHNKKEEIKKLKEEQQRNKAATVIQARYRGNRVRLNCNRKIAEIRHRLREGALKTNQQSLKERNEEAIDELNHTYDIVAIIQAVRSLEMLTEVFPMMYNDNAASIVRRVYILMDVTNRSLSSIELLTAAAALLVNLTRYRVTGPKIYARDRIAPILKFMYRFSNSEPQLFCILCTYLWLFSKYDGIKENLTEYLNLPENLKLLTAVRGSVDRMKRMANNTRNQFNKPKAPTKGQSNLNYSVCSNSNRNNSILLPAVEPDYGITKVDKPKYFQDAQQAITCLFYTYNLLE